jgi:AraC-like DNA-binding protein
MFRRYFGVSAGEFVQRLRLRDAVRELVLGTPIATAAARAGFSDQSHLTRVMRDTLGIMPGRAVRRLGGLPTPEDARLVTSDVVRFWNIFDRSASHEELAHLLETDRRRWTRTSIS